MLHTVRDYITWIILLGVLIGWAALKLWPDIRAFMGPRLRVAFELWAPLKMLHTKDAVDRSRAERRHRPPAP